MDWNAEIANIHNRELSDLRDRDCSCFKNLENCHLNFVGEAEAIVD